MTRLLPKSEAVPISWSERGSLEQCTPCTSVWASPPAKKIKIGNRKPHIPRFGSSACRKSYRLTCIPVGIALSINCTSGKFITNCKLQNHCYISKKKDVKCYSEQLSQNKEKIKYQKPMQLIHRQINNQLHTYVCNSDHEKKSQIFILSAPKKIIQIHMKLFLYDSYVCIDIVFPLIWRVFQVRHPI